MTDENMKIPPVGKTGGFLKYNGVEIISADDEMSVVEADITENHRNIWNAVHGGFTFTLADTAAGVLVRQLSKRPSVTLDGSMTFLLATQTSKRLRAVGRPVRVGNHVSHIQVEVWDDAGRLVATAQFNMFFTDTASPSEDQLHQQHVANGAGQNA